MSNESCVAIILVHGVGGQQAGYSAQWARLLKGTEPSLQDVEFIEVWWQQDSLAMEAKYVNSPTSVYPDAVTDVLESEWAEKLGDAAEVYASEVAFYILDPDFRNQVHSRVRAAYNDARHRGLRNLYVIGHSLGTVVAYYALRHMRQGFLSIDDKVRSLITVASPLAVPVFNGRRAPKGGVDFPRPRVCDSWLNVWGSLDPIAAIWPLRDTSNGADHLTFNHDFGVQGADPHGMDKYLQIPEVIQRIRDEIADTVEP